MRIATLIPTLAVLATIGAVTAADNLDLQVHGFASQGYLLTRNNALYSPESENHGTFDLNDHSTTLRSLSNGNLITTSGSAATKLTVNQSVNTTFAGSLEDGDGGGSGVLSLTKSGIGTLNISTISLASSDLLSLERTYFPSL